MTLEYDSAYRLRCRLMLASGRRITLKSLDQSMTYSGLLEGVPNSWFNDRLVAKKLESARASCVFGGSPHLIMPARRGQLRGSGEPSPLESKRPAEEWLPMVTCTAVFDSSSVREGDGSSLTLVWFQDEFALPIAEPALSSLLGLDWNALATDFEF